MSNNKFDELLAQIGTGRWNFMFFFTIAYWNMHLASHVLSGAFLAPKVDYSCQTPEDGFTVISTVVSKIDGSENNSTDHCEYMAKNESSEGGLYANPCTEWEYDDSTHTSTLTSEFDLVCKSEYLRATYQSMFMFGTFLGSPLNGILSDKLGRKTMLTIGTIIFATVAVGSSWIPNFSAILATRFILGFLYPCGLQTGYILCMEVCEPRFRSIVGVVMALPWAFGTIIWGGLAYFIRDWRWLQLSISLAGVLFLPFLWFLDESPRWLIVEGKFDRANKVLQKAALWNNVTLPPEEDLNMLMRSIQKESSSSKKVENQEEAGSCKQKSLHYLSKLFVLFKTPKLRKTTLIIYIQFFMVSMVYYGISLNAVNYSANPFVYMILNGVAEIPAYTVTAPIVATFGRRLPSTLLYLLSGSAIFACAFISPVVDPRLYPPSDTSVTAARFPGVEDIYMVPKEYVGPPIPQNISWLVMALAMFGKMCLSGAYQILYLYSTELFPTEVRMQALGSATISSRVGSMISPFITELLGPLYPRAPSILFGISAVIAGIATIPLRETLGKPLPDTIADLESPATIITQDPEEPDEETEMSKLRA